MNSKKKIKHFVFGFGGAVVIIGAACKILHLSIGPLSGSMILGIGLGTEALLFLVDALDFSSINEQTPSPKPAPKKEFAFSEERTPSELPMGLLNESLKEEQAQVKQNLESLSSNVGELAGVYKTMLTTLERPQTPEVKTEKKPAKLNF